MTKWKGATAPAAGAPVRREDPASLAAPLVQLHFPPEDRIHVRLVFLPSPSKPGEHVGIHAKTHQLLDRPVEATYLNLVSPWAPFRRIG
jgi:hypothetical protein